MLAHIRAFQHSAQCLANRSHCHHGATPKLTVLYGAIEGPILAKSQPLSTVVPAEGTALPVGAALMRVAAYRPCSHSLISLRCHISVVMLSCQPREAVGVGLLRVARGPWKQLSPDDCVTPGRQTPMAP